MTTCQLAALHQCRIFLFVGNLDRRHFCAELSESHILQSAGNTAAYKAEVSTVEQSHAAVRLQLLYSTHWKQHDSQTEHYDSISICHKENGIRFSCSDFRKSHTLLLFTKVETNKLGKYTNTLVCLLHVINTFSYPRLFETTRLYLHTCLLYTSPSPRDS